MGSNHYALMAAGIVAAFAGPLSTGSYDPLRLGRRRYDAEDPAPAANPKADKRKANHVKAMQEKRARRREMSRKGR